MKARRIIARDEASFRSQFFQSLRRHFSNHEMARSTTHLFGITAKVCSSLLLATSTSASRCSRGEIGEGFPVVTAVHQQLFHLPEQVAGNVMPRLSYPAAPAEALAPGNARLACGRERRDECSWGN